MKIIHIKNNKYISNDFTGKAIWENGDTGYYLNGRAHRLDGPAYIGCNVFKAYYINGKCICDSDDENHEQRFYNSKEYKQAILLEAFKKIKGCV